MASWKVQKRIKQVAVLNAYMFNLIIHIKAKVTVSTVFTDGFCSHLIPQRALHPILPKTRSQIRRNTVDNHFVLTLNSWEATFIQDARFVQQRVQSASRELHRDFSWLLWSPEISYGSTARSRQLTPKQHQNRGLLQKDLAERSQFAIHLSVKFLVDFERAAKRPKQMQMCCYAEQRMHHYLGGRHKTTRIWILKSDGLGSISVE